MYILMDWNECVQDSQTNTNATPNIDDVIIIKHYGEKLAVVTRTDGTKMNVNFMKADGDVTKLHSVTIDSDKWRPISDADKKQTYKNDEDGTTHTGTIQSFDTESLEFTVKWDDDTEEKFDFNQFTPASAEA